MRSHALIRSAVIVAGLLLISLFMLFAVSEYEKSMAFQWESMVQPHWEGVVPRQPLLLPLASEKTDEITVSSKEEEEEEEEEKNPPKPNKLSSEVTQKIPVVKETAVVDKVVAKEKSSGISQEPKPLVAPKKALRLRLKDDLYDGRSARWDIKKQKVMPDFFSQKQEEQRDVQLGGRLIMEGDDNSTANRNNQNRNNGGNDYLDAVQGAELNISIKMR